MTLFFMLASMLVSSVNHAIRVAERGAEQALETRDLAVRHYWLREVIGASVLPPPSPQLMPPALLGSSTEIVGRSLRLPSGKTNGPQDYRIELVRDTARDEMRVVLTAVGEGAELLRWLGRDGSFLYLGETDQWQSSWPAQSPVAESQRGGNTTGSQATAERQVSPLPKAIALRYRVQGAVTEEWLVIAIQDRAPPPPSAKELAQ
jgi:hypothetical protein